MNLDRRIGFTPVHLDIEATGSTPGKHQVLSIATLDFTNGKTTYHEIRHDEVLVVPKAMEVNQIDITTLDSEERSYISDADGELGAYFRTFDRDVRPIPVGRSVAHYDIAMMRSCMPETVEALGFAHLELNSLIYHECMKKGQPYPMVKSQLMRNGKTYAEKKTNLEAHHALFDVYADAHILATLTGTVPEWMAI